MTTNERKCNTFHHLFYFSKNISFSRGTNISKHSHHQNFNFWTATFSAENRVRGETNQRNSVENQATRRRQLLSKNICMQMTCLDAYTSMCMPIRCKSKHKSTLTTQKRGKKYSMFCIGLNSLMIILDRHIQAVTTCAVC